ncbi:MAG: cytochrome c peroxidase [Burkholderiales bacterium]|jgi:cytochrome c peroxidase
MSAAHFLLLPVALACALHAYAETASNKPVRDEPIRPLPEKIDVDPDKLALGKRLFFDPRLSRDNSVSCASCHNFSKGGSDGLARSLGVDRRIGSINAPTVFNAAYNFRQLWTGKAESLEEQLDLAIIHPRIFDTSWTVIVDKLSKDATLVRHFKSVYPDGLNRRNIVNALTEYERALITPSRFDAWLRGNETAITADEKLGYTKFKSYGCVGCHQGINVGGNMFQVFGVARPYLKKEGIDETDLGRYLLTGRESDKYVFKVPGLRNVANTAPYFHDGSAQTLEQAVDVMLKHQLGRTGTPEDKALIVKFLGTLSGEPPLATRPEPAK